VKKNIKLLNLHPFLDKDAPIRVGGRLQEASIDSSQKHQIILSPKCHLTRLISEEHLRLLHGDPQISQWEITVQEVCSLLHPLFQDEGLMGEAADGKTSTAASYSRAPIL
jgi:hypothetical protein